MNRKQQRLLKAIFTKPASGTLAWSDVESLLVSLGCTVKEGNGSRVKFVYGEFMLVIHRPHPRKEAREWHVKVVREFLTNLGVKP